MLRERQMAIFHGLTREQMSQRFPDELRACDQDVNAYVIPTGESGVRRGERGLRALRHIAERHRKQTVLVPVRTAAKALGVSVNTYQRERRACQQSPAAGVPKDRKSDRVFEPSTT
jgi:broad specificity phosphatase PhoE